MFPNLKAKPWEPNYGTKVVEQPVFNKSGPKFTRYVQLHVDDEAVCLDEMQERRTGISEGQCQICAGDRDRTIRPSFLIPRSTVMNLYSGQRYIQIQISDSHARGSAPERFQQVAPAELYRPGEDSVPLYCDTLVFTYDNRRLLSLNSCNILIPGFPAVKYVSCAELSAAAFFWQNFAHKGCGPASGHISIARPECSRK